MRKFLISVCSIPSLSSKTSTFFSPSIKPLTSADFIFIPPFNSLGKEKLIDKYPLFISTFTFLEYPRPTSFISQKKTSFSISLVLISIILLDFNPFTSLTLNLSVLIFIVSITAVFSPSIFHHLKQTPFFSSLFHHLNKTNSILFFSSLFHYLKQTPTCYTREFVILS